MDLDRDLSAKRKEREMDDESDLETASDTSSDSDATVPVPNKMTIDTAISSRNIGFKMLQKMGYTGQGLGKNEQGRIDPIRVSDQVGFMGLGKLDHDNRMLDTTTLSKKELTSIALANETEQERLIREEQLEQKKAIKIQVAETLRVFHCDICNKGYQNARQWDEHLNSYDHHHKKRKIELAVEMKQAAQTSGEIEKRRLAEKKREEKQLRKMGIVGGFASAPAPAPLAPPPPPPPAETDSAPPASQPAAKAGFQKVGWNKAASSLSNQATANTTGSSSSSSQPPMFQSSSSSSSQPPMFQSSGSTSSTFDRSSNDDTPKPQEWVPSDATGRAQQLHPLLGGPEAPLPQPDTLPTVRPVASTSSRFRPMPMPAFKRAAPTFNAAGASVSRPDPATATSTPSRTANKGNVFGGQEEDEEMPLGASTSHRKMPKMPSIKIGSLKR